MRSSLIRPLIPSNGEAYHCFHLLIPSSGEAYHCFDLLIPSSCEAYHCFDFKAIETGVKISIPDMVYSAH